MSIQMTDATRTWLLRAVGPVWYSMFVVVANFNYGYPRMAYLETVEAFMLFVVFVARTHLPLSRSIISLDIALRCVRFILASMTGFETIEIAVIYGVQMIASGLDILTGVTTPFAVVDQGHARPPRPPGQPPLQAQARPVVPSAPIEGLV